MAETEAWQKSFLRIVEAVWVGIRQTVLPLSNNSFANHINTLHGLLDREDKRISLARGCDISNTSVFADVMEQFVLRKLLVRENVVTKDACIEILRRKSLECMSLLLETLEICLSNDEQSWSDHLIYRWVQCFLDAFQAWAQFGWARKLASLGEYTSALGRATAVYSDQMFTVFAGSVTTALLYNASLRMCFLDFHCNNEDIPLRLMYQIFQEFGSHVQVQYVNCSLEEYAALTQDPHNTAWLHAVPVKESYSIGALGDMDEEDEVIIGYQIPSMDVKPSYLQEAKKNLCCLFKPNINPTCRSMQFSLEMVNKLQKLDIVPSGGPSLPPLSELLLSQTQIHPAVPPARPPPPAMTAMTFQSRIFQPAIPSAHSFATQPSSSQPSPPKGLKGGGVQKPRKPRVVKPKPEQQPFQQPFQLQQQQPTDEQLQPQPPPPRRRGRPKKQQTSTVTSTYQVVVDLPMPMLPKSPDALHGNWVCFTP